VRLADAHAVVTGGSQGIGLATARALASRGARVSLVARDPDRLAAAGVSITGSVAVPADVTDADGLAAALGRLVAEQGPADLLVTSAGASHPGYFDALDIEVFRAQMELNYLGTVHAIKALLPPMLDRGRGGIVGVSSTAGLLGVFGFGAYGPTKYAVRGLCDALRAEYGHRGIYVGCVFPPDTETPGFEAENRIKPRETAAVSGGIAPKSAEAIGEAIARGIERERAVITADLATALLARVGGLVRGPVEWTMQRTVCRVQGR